MTSVTLKIGDFEVGDFEDHLTKVVFAIKCFAADESGLRYLSNQQTVVSLKYKTESEEQLRSFSFTL